MQLLPSTGDSHFDETLKDKKPKRSVLEKAVPNLTGTASDGTVAFGGNTIYFTIDSVKSLAKVCVDLDRSFIRHEFDVLAIHDLKENMKEKGIEFTNECIVYEVSDPKLAKRLLDGNPQMAMIFPCKIVVYETLDGKRRLSALCPTRLIELSGSIQLKIVAKEIEDVLETIMKEAAK